MILTSLYPDSQTVASPSGDNKFTNSFSNLWTGTNRIIANIDAYYLGYIAYDDLPSYSKIGNCTSLGNNVYQFTDITDHVNFPLGYINAEGTYDCISAFMEDGGLPGDRILANQYRLINQLYPTDCGFRQSVSVNISAFVYGSDNAYIGQTYLSNLVHNGVSISSLSNMRVLLANPGYTITATVTVSGTNYGTVNFTTADWEEGFPSLLTTSTGAQVRLFFTGISCGPSVYIKNANGTDVTYKPISPFVKVTSGAKSYHKTIGSTGGRFDDAVARVRNGSFEWLRIYTSGYELGTRRTGLVGTVDVSTLSTSNRYTYDGNVLAWYYSNNLIYIITILTLDDLRKTLYLNFRLDMSSSTTLSYVNGITYATNVDGSDKFLAEIKTGDIENTEFKNGLRPWQYENFQSDEFDPANIPPYDPTPPTPPRPEPVAPGDKETDGDDADMNDPGAIGSGFGFTTMYGIRASHLSEIGAKLWSGFSDVTDYINNFVFAVDPTTGSVNLSDIMQFFISLRAYPCPLSAMASTSAGGTDMYIGSGAAPLSLTTPFSIVDSYIGHIDAGSVDIPFWYGDYRDYALEIICYLPYCGTVQLNAGDVIGGTLSAYYTVDFCSGACMAYVLCTTWEDKTILVGSLPGQLGADIPMTATNAGQVMARMYGDRINVAENLLGAAKNGATGIGAIMSGNIAGAIRSGISAFIDPAIANEKQLAEMGSRSAIAAPMLSGGRGLAAFGTSKTAYVQIRSPYYTEPSNYDHVVGTPAASAVRIGDCTGFCQFVNVDVSGITTDADDQNAIRAALESGVFI